MSILQSIILGIIQGITEFLPISSSGHLVILPYFFSWDYIPLYFTVTVHFGTLLAVVSVFYKDIARIIKGFFLGLFIKEERKSPDFKLSLFIILGTIPAAVIGFLAEDYAEKLFSSPLMVAAFLLVTALLLWTSEIGGRHMEKNARGHKKLSFPIALVVGLGQALAIFPGISRSGATISSARYFGINRKKAVRFSFLLSVPVILGSFIFEIFSEWAEIFSGGRIVLVNLLVGLIFSFIAGYFAIKFLLNMVSKKNLNVFAIYCTALSVIIFAFYFITKLF